MSTVSLGLSDWIAWCRVMRHSLGAGLTLVEVMKQQSKRSSASVRAFTGRVLEQLQKGRSLSAALERETVPPMVKNMIQVGEEVGHLPEIFGELEGYFRAQEKMQREFWSKATMPIIQLGIAILIVGGVIWILGFIAQMTNSRPIFTYFGLSGAAGSLAFFGTVASVVVGFFVTRALIRQNLAGSVIFERIGLTIPVIGPCIFAVAMHRFTLALHLTMGAGLDILRALQLSLEATSNAHFQQPIPFVLQALQDGKTLTEALERSDLFPEEFLAIVATAEEAGSVPESMKQQAEYYQEESSRKMSQLTYLATGFVFLLYLVFAVAAIFTLANVYLNALKI